MSERNSNMSASDRFSKKGATFQIFQKTTLAKGGQTLRRASQLLTCNPKVNKCLKLSITTTGRANGG